MEVLRRGLKVHTASPCLLMHFRAGIEVRVGNCDCVP